MLPITGEFPCSTDVEFNSAFLFRGGFLRSIWINSYGGEASCILVITLIARIAHIDVSICWIEKVLLMD